MASKINGFDDAFCEFTFLRVPIAIPYEALLYPKDTGSGLIVSTFNYYYVLLLRSLPLKITYCYTPGNPCVPHGHWDRLILLILNFYYINGL